MTIEKYAITPVSAPRMTRSDKWKNRPSVVRYRAFCDAARYQRITITNGDHVLFLLPMPHSWSVKKKAAHAGAPHTQRPDIDNLAKALLDALFDEDSHIHDIRLTKIWGHDAGAIHIIRGVV